MRLLAIETVRRHDDVHHLGVAPAALDAHAKMAGKSNFQVVCMRSVIDSLSLH